MNRRVFTAGMAGLIPMSAVSQDATPEAEHRPGSLLRQYLHAVWGYRNPDAIADYFDPDAMNLLDVQRAHRIAVDGLREHQPLYINFVNANATTAMAYCTLQLVDDGEYDMFMLILVGSSGLINGYRWMAE
ncbi:MAG: hypothetical protein M3440_10515 [Chloroflexota bacterium]|nr:hypothetical protein [Chloroflexota bacterium]